VSATSTITTEATQASLSETSEPEKTTTISVTDNHTKSESTSVVILPVVSNGDSAPGEPSSQESNKPIPAFVFPLVVVLLFVIIYLSTRWSLKKPQDEIQPK
jgi:ABC-type Na+ efflux pump permease subunit